MNSHLNDVLLLDLALKRRNPFSRKFTILVSELLPTRIHLSIYLVGRVEFCSPLEASQALSYRKSNLHTYLVFGRFCDFKDEFGSGLGKSKGNFIARFQEASLEPRLFKASNLFSMVYAEQNPIHKSTNGRQQTMCGLIRRR